MVRRISLCIAALVCFTASSVVADQIDLDAFVLAVQHFDPDHEIGLDSDGPEVEFMKQALAAAREAVPAAEGIHTRVEGPYRQPLSPTMYWTLELRGGDQSGSNSSATLDRMRAIGERIGCDCQFEKHTNERGRRGARPYLRTRTRWNLDRTCLDERDTLRCADAATVDWLRSHGVDSILLTERVSSRNRHSVRLYLGFKTLVDLDYLALVLMSDPLYGETFGDLTAGPYTGNLNGDGPTMEVIPCADLSGFDGVCLRFTVGWGDCEAGCIYSHYWVVRCEAGAGRTEEDWRITAERIEEGGDRLR